MVLLESLKMFGESEINWHTSLQKF